MYCHTHINQFSCVFNELQLWTHISSDHPNFLKTVANLSKVNLPKTAEDKLEDIQKKFSKLYNDIVHVKRTIIDNANPNLYGQHITEIKRLIDEFLLHDTHALSFYPQLLNFGKENHAWQELVKHIINEQTFMLELFEDLRQQIR
jgi:hypothetical protein